MEEEFIIPCIPNDLFEGFVLETISRLRDNGAENAINFLYAYHLSDGLINYLIDLAYRTIRMSSLTQEDLDAIGASYIEEYLKHHTFIN